MCPRDLVQSYLPLFVLFSSCFFFLTFFFVFVLMLPSPKLVEFIPQFTLFKCAYLVRISPRDLVQSYLPLFVLFLSSCLFSLSPLLHANCSSSFLNSLNAYILLHCYSSPLCVLCASFCFLLFTFTQIVRVHSPIDIL